MRSNLLVVALAGVTLICLWQSAVRSEGSALPADRLNLQNVQADSRGDQPQKDCCGDVQYLKDEIKQLEDRVKQLENKLNGDSITLGSGGSKIAISNSGILITANGSVSIRAAGPVSIKGSKVTEN